MTPDQISVGFSLLVTMVAVGGVFGFVSVVVYSENRRREREAFYRAEVHKRVLEQPQGGVEQLRALLLIEDAAQDRQMRKGFMIAGLLTTAVGTAMLLLQGGGGSWSLWKVGWIPALAGVAMLIFVALTSSRRSSRSGNDVLEPPKDSTSPRGTR